MSWVDIDGIIVWDPMPPFPGVAWTPWARHGLIVHPRTGGPPDVPSPAPREAAE